MADEQVEVEQVDRERKKRIQKRFLTDGISHSQVLDEELAYHRQQSVEAALKPWVDAVEEIASAMEYPNQLESGFVHSKPTFKDMSSRVEIASSIARALLATRKEIDNAS